MHTAMSQGINMLNTLRNYSMSGARLKGVLAAFLLAGSGAATAAVVTVNLCATTGTLSLPALPSAISAPVWGYATGPCSPTTVVSAPGGPVIAVDVGDVVTVNLQNKLTQATGLLFQGQSMVPDRTGAGPATVSTFPTKTYTFTASNPGTFLYEAALLPNAQHQVAMGLNGAFVVRPVKPVRIDAAAGVTLGSTVVTDAAVVATDIGSAVTGTGVALGSTITGVTPGVSFTMSAAATASATGVTVTAPATAYASAATTYQDEAVLVLSEIDPALNTSANPAGFDMRNYAPKYFLINGKPYPSTDPIATAAGRAVLLRYVNAGAKHHSMSVLGLRQIFVAKDGSTLPTLNHNVAAETLAAGQTGDAIVTVPAAAITASRFAVYDASLALHNGNAAGFGGMLTFVATGGAAAAAGPVVTALSLVGNNVAATITAATGQTVTAAEYWIDSGAHTAITVTTPGGAVNVAATIPAQPSGSHVLYVRGQDGAAVWGAPRSVAFTVDTTGPTTSGLTLTPNPSNGTTNVALHGTADDTATGGSNVSAAEYQIDGGAAIAMVVNVAAPVASLDAVIPAATVNALAQGAHTISVRSRDALNNWGAYATITLNVVKTAPVASAVSASPNPNNGAVPLNASQPVVRVTATLTSAGSAVSAAEAFIDTVGANGTGFPFVPSDGVWNGAVEIGYADIPLVTVNALPTGNHTIYVRGRDATGNWGITASTVLLIDHIVPTISAASLTPVNTVAFGSVSVTLNVTAADTGGSGLAGGQYWIDGTATPPAAPSSFTGTSATIGTSALAGGTHTVYARMKDAAGNWSAVSNVTLYVIQAVADARAITANGSAAQTSDANAAAGVLTNDQPTGLAGRTVKLASAPIRTVGAGTGTIVLSCTGALGTAATPVISGNTLCTNGAYRVTLNGVGANNNARQASKRGTFQFTYTETLNGVTSAPATVTITVN